MSARTPIPWPGMALAAMTLTMLNQTALPKLVLVLVGLFWLLSLWVEWLRPRPAPQMVERPTPNAPEQVTIGGIRASIEAMGFPLVVIDHSRVLAANQAARDTFGRHIIGQDARIALRHPDAVRLLDMADGESVTIRGLTGAGSLWQVTRRRIDAGHWAIELRDRTAEADISRAHTDFVANASHELRTPLASIIGYIETLVDTPEGMDPAMRLRFLNIVLSQAQRMQALVADLMSLSQLEAEKHDAPTEPVDMNALAQMVTASFAPLPGQRESRVCLTLPGDGVALTVQGDPRQLEQLLRNLVDNALKYGHHDTPVRVILDHTGADGRRPMAVLQVIDQGAGIAPDHLPHLTRRFYRTDPGRSQSAGGTGLGLAIVKHIVERHRGQLDIASEVGVGTCFTIRLPLTGARLNAV
ncbi:two-component sensor histidine kinase [Novosphingobium sp. FSY-8]|uniref:histidine kinase n=1 Tax=Novosphingobium ovatum TaxID=1908523 RepID=A0ABW9XCU7_9SPHN|nr:ATP-binding protein [Novosphingobium ovatum]NBC36368.1 two-component sensor histidine kinase [Novosphingobium ovatum]